MRFQVNMQTGFPSRPRCYNPNRPNANVAELADALDLGSSARKGMGVRPSPFAPA